MLVRDKRAEMRRILSNSLNCPFQKNNGALEQKMMSQVDFDLHHSWHDTSDYE
jgi:hypothetical protein